MGWFRGLDSYSKLNAFLEHKHTDLAVKCVLFRYFMRELLPLGAVNELQLPVFLTSSTDKSSTLCMYTTTQLRIWFASHLIRSTSQDKLLVS